MSQSIINDQAQALREMVHRQKAQLRMITVTSGKGGVGKTSVTVNLALALSQMGCKVLVVDADFGLANIDVMLGINSVYNLSHLLKGQRTLSEIIRQGHQGVRFISGGSGVYDLLSLDSARLGPIVDSLLDLGDEMDIIMFDTGAGINDNVLQLVMASTETVIITTPEPTAILDAYALVKTINKREGAPPVRLVMNKAESRREAENATEGFQAIIRKYLSMDVDSLGYVMFDPEVTKSIKRQTPIMISHPGGQAARNIYDIAKTLVQRETYVRPAGPLSRLFSRVWK